MSRAAMIAGEAAQLTDVLRGIRQVDQHFKLTMLASNLSRMARIMTVIPQGVAR